MASFNKVLLMGNLTRDPQTRQLPTQSMVAEFGLAMNRKFRTQQGEDREEVTKGTRCPPAPRPMTVLPRPRIAP